jgi:ABC-type phosphate transport system substrate-binding protein
MGSRIALLHAGRDRNSIQKIAREEQSGTAFQFIAQGLGARLVSNGVLRNGKAVPDQADGFRGNGSLKDLL